MERSRKNRTALGRTLCLTAVFIVLFVSYYFFHRQTQIISSDITTMLPMLSDALAGNVMMRGWVVGTNSFLFTDTLWCAPGMALNLSYGQIMAYTAALFRAGVIVLLIAGFMPPKKRSDYVGIIFFVFAAGIIPTDAVYTELNLNSHNGTYFVAAMELLVLKRYLDSEKWGWLVLYTAAGVLIFASDSISLMVLFGPVALVGAYYALIGRRRGAALLCVVSSALCIAAGKLLPQTIEASGGLEIVGLGMHIISDPGALAERARVFLEAVYILVGFKPQFWNGFSLFALLSNGFIAAILVLAAANCVLALFQKAEYRALLLSMVVLANVVCFIFTDVAYSCRYVVPYTLFGGLLLALSLNRALSRLTARPVKLAAAVLLLLLTVYHGGVNARAVAGTYELYVASVADEQAAAQYIKENNLGNGYGDFWSASLISSYTDFDSMIYQVFSYEEGFSPYGELIHRDWYEQEQIHYAVVYAEDERNTMCRKADIVHFAGEPDVDLIFGEYELLGYNKDLSAYLGGRPVLGEGEFTFEENWPFFSDFIGADGRIISDAPGTLVYGPYYTMPAGEYSVTFYYSCEDNDGWGKGIVDVFSNDVDLGWEKYQRSIDPGTDSVTIPDIVLEKNVSNFEIRMLVNAAGVEIKRIEIRKTAQKEIF